MMSKKTREEIAFNLFPYMCQVVYNSFVIFTKELNGKWWKLPDDILSAAKEDCSLILDFLKYCGLKTPADSLSHIDKNKIDEISRKFSWYHMDNIEKVANKLADSLLTERLKVYKIKYKNLAVKLAEHYATEIAESQIKQYRENLPQDVYARERILDAREKAQSQMYQERIKELEQAQRAYEEKIKQLEQDVDEGLKNQEKLVKQLQEKIKDVGDLEKMFYAFTSLYRQLIPDKRTLNKVSKKFEKIKCMFLKLKRCY